MAVTDQYIVGYLLEATRERSDPLVWRSDGGSGHWTEVNGVRIELSHTQTVGWSGYVIVFGRGEQSAHIAEPRPASMFGRKYGSADESRLAESMRALASVVSDQCRKRKAEAWRERESIRDGLFRRVLFGEVQKV